MAKLALMLPSQEMAGQAARLLEQEGLADRAVLLVVPDAQGVSQAAGRALAQGAEIFLARGLVAAALRSAYSVPVVELRLTAQELGVLAAQCKKLCGKAHPVVAVVGLANTFCDFSLIGELLELSLRPYLVSPSAGDTSALLRERVRQAIDEGADAVIGGGQACAQAEAAGIPHVFLSAGMDSLREGLRAARQVGFARDLEKDNTAEMRALLDSSFTAAVKLDASGRVAALNKAAESLLGWHRAQVSGQELTALLREITPEQMEQVLAGQRELFSVFLSVNGTQLAANLASVRAADGRVTGAIFSCQEMRALEEMSLHARREEYRSRARTGCTFDLLPAYSPALKQAYETARLYARSSAPVFLEGEPGLLQRRLAQAVHNAGSRRGEPFVCFDCAAQDGAALFGGLDGQGGACRAAHGGTLFLDHVEALGPSGQSQLLQLITEGAVTLSGSQPLPLDVRLIAASSRSPAQLADRPEFSPALVCALCCLFLRLPPLRECPEDVDARTDALLEAHSRTYKRFIVLSAGARQWMRTCPWPFNDIQLRSFCEHIVLCAPRRNVDEVYLQSVYELLFPGVSSAPRVDARPQPLSEEARVLVETLSRFDGNRSKTAQALGISTSTLWRRMKRLRITGGFSLEP